MNIKAIETFLLRIVDISRTTAHAYYVYLYRIRWENDKIVSSGIRKSATGIVGLRYQACMSEIRKASML
jgi:hypothetical protein